MEERIPVKKEIKINEDKNILLTLSLSNVFKIFNFKIEWVENIKGNQNMWVYIKYQSIQIGNQVVNHEHESILFIASAIAFCKMRCI